MYLLQFHFSLCFPPLKQTNDVKKKIAGLFMILGQVFFFLAFSMEAGRMKGTYITLRYVSHTAPCLEMFHIHVHKSNSSPYDLWPRALASCQRCRSLRSKTSWREKLHVVMKCCSNGKQFYELFMTPWGIEKIYSVRAVMISSHSSRRTLIFFLSSGQKHDI